MERKIVQLEALIFRGQKTLIRRVVVIGKREWTMYYYTLCSDTDTFIYHFCDKK